MTRKTVRCSKQGGTVPFIVRGFLQRRTNESKSSVLSEGCHRLIDSYLPHTQCHLSGGEVNTRRPILPQGPWAFSVNSFPLEAQFMSLYSTGLVTFRLWHLFLFRYQAWFLSNQLAPLPLTSSIREPAYDTSRTGQTEINPGQISA